jgi:hypothetical protein
VAIILPIVMHLMYYLEGGKRVYTLKVGNRSPFLRLFSVSLAEAIAVGPGHFISSPRSVFSGR